MMDTKLTLSLDKKIIEEAKKYARKRNMSLSGLIENYLASVTSRQKAGGEDISPLVSSLSGVLDLKDGGDHRNKYAEHLAGKYK